MRKEKLIKDANHISSEAKKTQKKRRSCWHCNLITDTILDKHGCCKRCGTNLTKYPTRKFLPYPKELIDHKLLEDNVLGDRAKFTLPEDTGEY